MENLTERHLNGNPMVWKNHRLSIDTGYEKDRLRNGTPMVKESLVYFIKKTSNMDKELYGMKMVRNA